MREEGDTIVVGPVQSLSALHARVKAEMQAAGTWGKPVSKDGAWAEAAAERYMTADAQS